ncbi:endonuclease III [Ruminococcaceae bacterium OttesenSCG-928-D13]|nr:endonuclease III [Ruminococcaceae bacterium OttesenSCG-928-D13]
MRTKADAVKIVEALKNEYPVGICSLDYDNAWQLMVAVRLSAQCTDARVNEITPVLFAKYPTLKDLAGAEVSDIEEIIHSCGFFRGKARDIHAAAGIVLTQYGGRLPSTMEELLALPGVGRKSANLILGDVYNVPGVVIADTHCIRISNRLGFVQSKDPMKVETALRKVLPPEESNNFCHRLVLHGRAVCTARAALCERCVLAGLCPKKGVAPLVSGGS